MTFVRWILIIGLFYLIYRVLKGLALPGRHRPAQPPRPASEPVGGSRTEELVQDPECGVYLPRSEGLASLVDGQVIYFCSQDCRDKYLRKRAGGTKQGGQA